MQNQIIDQLTTASTKSYETIKSLGEINSGAIRKLSDLQFDFISTSMESGVDQFNSFSSMRNIKDIFAVGSEFTSENNEKLKKITRQALKIFSQASDETRNLIEKIVASKVVTSKQAPAKEAPVKVAKKSAAKVSTKKST